MDDMRKVFVPLAVVVGILLLSDNLASAYPDYCVGFAANAVKNSQKMRALAQMAPGGRCTGHNLLDPFWSTNSVRQRQWCSSVSEETAYNRIAELAGDTK
jgi:hypothetical protein